jgi:hypothetical protein
MAKALKEDDLTAIEEIIQGYPGGVSVAEIADALKAPVPRRTLQYWLKSLVDAARIVTEGEGRGAKYLMPAPAKAVELTPINKEAVAAAEEEAVPLSAASQETRRHVSQPIAARKPVGYNRVFLDSYQPNKTFYLTEAERARLAEVSKPNFSDQAAGIYAKQILNKLLIDLSWNSSRLEGNTYSLWIRRD